MTTPTPTLLQRAATAARTGADPAVSRETVTRIPIDQVTDNPWQYRINYTDIEDLAADIRRNGLLQPPVARRLPDETVQIAFGHRRLRACRAAGMRTMPLFLSDLTDEQMSDYAWAENQQRSDTSAVEQARAIRRAMADFNWTQEQVAARWGLARPTIANKLRLLDLPEETQQHVIAGTLGERHARALLTLTDDPATLTQLATTAATTNQTARELETAVAEHRQRIDAAKEQARQIALIDAAALGVPWLTEWTSRCSVFKPNDYWANAGLLDRGECGPGQCDCLRLYYSADSLRRSDTDARPLPTDAPHVYWCCSQDDNSRQKYNDWQKRQQAQSANQDTTQRQAQQAEKERIAATERARREASAQKLLASITDRWPLADLWNDIRFWHFIEKEVGYNTGACFRNTETLAHACRNLLEAAIITRSWEKEFGHVIDLTATTQKRNRLFTALTP